MAKLKYITSQKYDAPKGFLQYCADAYTRVATQKLAELEKQSHVFLNMQNELAVAEDILDRVFEVAEEHQLVDCEKYETYLWRFDTPAIWNDIFLEKLLWDYISRSEISRRSLDGFRIGLLYKHLEDIFKKRYVFKSSQSLPGYEAKNEEPLDTKMRFDSKMYIGEYKIEPKLAEKALLGAKFKKETGLKFVAEKQENYLKISLYKNYKYLWSEVV